MKGKRSNKTGRTSEVRRLRKKRQKYNTLRGWKTKNATITDNYLGVRETISNEKLGTAKSKSLSK